MPAARLTICEATTRWGLALRSFFTHSDCRVIVASSMANAFSALRRQPQNVLAIEVVEANAEQCFRELSTIRRDSKKCCVIVLLSEPLTDCDRGSELATWYEAGAAAVAVVPQQLDLVYRLVQRHMETSKKQPMTFREQVWQRMPWSHSGITS